MASWYWIKECVKYNCGLRNKKKNDELKKYWVTRIAAGAIHELPLQNRAGGLRLANRPYD
jgi:hypothetical protein